jgi:hypothetical protein
VLDYVSQLTAILKSGGEAGLRAELPAPSAKKLSAHAKPSSGLERSDNFNWGGGCNNRPSLFPLSFAQKSNDFRP